MSIVVHLSRSVYVAAMSGVGFVLLVEWDSVEAHTVGFRESANFGKLR